MASVVIIHAQEDALPARALAEKLRLSGFAPLVDQVGKDGFRDALRDAAAIVALWSPRSNQNHDLIEEAQFARDARPLLHIRMQNAANPDPFANDNSIDLTGWRGEDEFPAWRDALKAVAREAGVAEPAMPARAASPFFQPGASAPARMAGPLQAATPGAAIHPMPIRPAPAPQRQNPAQLAATALSEERLAPIRPLSDVSLSPYASARSSSDFREPVEPKSSSGGGKLALIGGITFLVVAGVGLGGYFAWDRYNASQSANAAWATIDASDPVELQTFLNDHHGSSHDAEARQRLGVLDADAYRHARAADTVEAFQRYVSDFPDGENVLAARGRIAELQQMPSADTSALTPALDPATGQPIDPTAPLGTDNPDLVPPGIDMNEQPDSTGGPVPLAPRSAPEPAAPAPQDPGPGPAQLGPPQ